MITWYLEEIGNEIETEEELIEQKQVIEKVVDKLIYQDQVILSHTLMGLYYLLIYQDHVLLMAPSFNWND